MSILREALTQGAYAYLLGVIIGLALGLPVLFAARDLPPMELPGHELMDLAR